MSGFRLVPDAAVEPVEVDVSLNGWGTGVRLSNVNVHAQLTPDQARSLAVALIEAAHRAERPLSADEWP
ncbi:hypothetical protein [Agromyces sp. NPDC058104]|uniref:hypothetical protein n=1 Tax=Agromyces sp. NPDC058104 TaxID=3346342 RepID=UPI0036DF659F